MASQNRSYDLAFYVRGLLGMIAMCVCMKLTGGTAFLAIFVLALIAFSKNSIEMLLYLLLMTAFLTNTNAYIAPKGFSFSIVARLLYLLVGSVMMLQLTAQRASKQMTPVLSLFLYLAYSAIISFVGFNPLISYLKLILFSIIFLAMYSVGNAAITKRSVSPAKLRSVFLCMATFLIIGSVAVIPFPAIGMMGAQKMLEQKGFIDGGLFQGITIQSQCLGPSVAMLAVVLLADLLFSVRRWDKLYLLLLVCTPVLIYKTGSRTALGTFIVGLACVVFFFINARGLGARWKNRATSALMVLFILGGCVLFMTPQIRNQVISFLYKTGGREVAEEKQTFSNFVSSRQRLMDNAMSNFRNSPWIGNGFQVSDAQQNIEIYSWKQLLSAPIEKGVWLTAILEEGGGIGMGVFIFVLLITFYGLLSHQSYIGASALIVFLASNLGEFTFFSMSYTGGVMWSLTFTGIALDAQRKKSQGIEKAQSGSLSPAPYYM